MMYSDISHHCTEHGEKLFKIILYLRKLRLAVSIGAKTGIG